ncbi:minor capsid protein [Clostridium paraputrificum]|uniref:minor capsid protein n=1 Tax=Clostridium paraputrificum TaxID=29363 RepID=UPI00040E1B84|nr:minor capsid protein [Clostridium paraputrificum]
MNNIDFEANQEYWEKRIEAAKNTFLSKKDKDKALINAYKKALDDIQIDILKLYEKIDNEEATLTDFHNYNRLSKLQKQINSTLKQLGKEEIKYMNSTIKDAIKAGASLDSNFALLNKKVIDKMVSSPWIGEDFSKRVWKELNNLEFTLNDVLKRGIIQGETIAKIAKNIAKEMNNSYGRAYTLARTETMHYFNEGAKESYRQAGIKKVKWFTATDERRCSVCGAMHNKEYAIDKAPIIPAHPRCRCTYIPVIDIPEDRENMINKLKGLDVESYTNKRKLGRDILDTLGLNETYVMIDDIKDYGFCTLKVKNNIAYLDNYVLKSNDIRAKEYQIKTAFHEAFHALATGRKTDYHINKHWLEIEETFAESAAHYLTKVMGINKDIAPSYPEKLIEMLPRLKKLPKFKNCNTIADFGKIALEERLNGAGSEWATLFREAKSQGYNYIGYAKKHYLDYIKENKEELIDVMLENIPEYKKYKPNMMDDLEYAIKKVDKELNLDGNDKFVFQRVLSIVINRVGVK